MTMHVILGDGLMARRELTAALADLWKKDSADQQSFWFLVQGKSEPTETDTAIVTWLEKNEVYYEVVTDDQESMNAVYSQPQEIHTATKITDKVVALLQSKPEEDEPAEVLALFADVNDPAAAADKWLNGALQGAYDSGFTCRALNDGLMEIDLSVETTEAEQEPEEAPAKPVKAVAKKAAPKSDTEVPAEPAAADTGGAKTRAELEEMDPADIKEYAATLGIVLPPRTRATTYITHILGEADITPEAPAAVAEVAEVDVVSTNGHIPEGFAEGILGTEELATQVADLIWEKLRTAFANA